MSSYAKRMFSNSRSLSSSSALRDSNMSVHPMRRASSMNVGEEELNVQENIAREIAKAMEDVSYRLVRITDRLEARLDETMIQMSAMARELRHQLSRFKIENDIAYRAISCVESHFNKSDDECMNDKLNGKMSELDQMVSKFSLLSNNVNEPARTVHQPSFLPNYLRHIGPPMVPPAVYQAINNPEVTQYVRYTSSNIRGMTRYPYPAEANTQQSMERIAKLIVDYGYRNQINTSNDSVKHFDNSDSNSNDVSNNSSSFENTLVFECSRGSVFNFNSSSPKPKWKRVICGTVKLTKRGNGAFDLILKNKDADLKRTFEIGTSCEFSVDKEHDNCVCWTETIDKSRVEKYRIDFGDSRTMNTFYQAILECGVKSQPD